MPEAAVETPVAAEPTFLSYLKGGGGSSREVQPPAEETPPAAAEPDKTGKAAKPADGSDPSSQPTDKVEARKSEIQREIDAQVRRREAARREADAEEERVKKLRTETVPRETTPAAGSKAADGTDPNDPKPDESKYATWQDYNAANVRWEARQEFRKLQAEQVQRQQTEQQQKTQEQQKRELAEAVTDLEIRGTDYAADNPDYPDLVAKFKEKTVSPELQAILLWGLEEMDGPALLHELMKDQKELDKIEKLGTPIKRLNAYYALHYSKKISALEAKVKELEENQSAQPKQSAAPRVGTRPSGVGGGSMKEPKTFEQFRKQQFG